MLFFLPFSFFSLFLRSFFPGKKTKQSFANLKYNPGFAMPQFILVKGFGVDAASWERRWLIRKKIEKRDTEISSEHHENIMSMVINGFHILNLCPTYILYMRAYTTTIIQMFTLFKWDFILFIQLLFVSLHLNVIVQSSIVNNKKSSSIKWYRDKHHREIKNICETVWCQNWLTVAPCSVEEPLIKLSANGPIYQWYINIYTYICIYIIIITLFI